MSKAIKLPKLSKNQVLKGLDQVRNKRQFPEKFLEKRFERNFSFLVTKCNKGQFLFFLEFFDGIDKVSLF